MLVRPMKRTWPSDMRVARSNTERHAPGLRKGSRPSKTSISASAPSSRSPMSAQRAAYLRPGAAVAGAAPPRMALKNSLLGSTTMMSLLLRKAAR